MTGDASVERVLVRGGRAVGVAVRDGQRLTEIAASRVVLSAGAYGSPAILLRSGIGPASELTAVGVKPAWTCPASDATCTTSRVWRSTTKEAMT